MAMVFARTQTHTHTRITTEAFWHLRRDMAENIHYVVEVVAYARVYSKLFIYDNRCRDQLAQ